MVLRATLIAAAIATAALVMAGLGPGLAHADPNQTCTPPTWVPGPLWHTLGHAHHLLQPGRQLPGLHVHGDGGQWPGTCINYPAAPAPAPGGLLPINPPVPGVPPPPPQP
jgi:hypothetical protein